MKKKHVPSTVSGFALNPCRNSRESTFDGTIRATFFSLYLAGANRLGFSLAGMHRATRCPGHVPRRILMMVSSLDETGRTALGNQIQGYPFSATPPAEARALFQTEGWITHQNADSGFQIVKSV
jgi:hypothetical protein